MKGLLRFFLGVALLPACWGAARVLIDALLIATGREGGWSRSSSRGARCRIPSGRTSSATS